jgi:hypothetical protein
MTSQPVEQVRHGVLTTRRFSQQYHIGADKLQAPEEALRPAW